ncbi:MAG: hypothetical protein KAU20_00810, partial [Nanoarchaeota archaeon]|nr:hypothetical protein [Nanoarchaeota archaeon]
LAIVAIHPSFGADSVTIRNVLKNSSAFSAGIESPKPTAAPMSKERIISMNSIPIMNIGDYYDFVSGLEINRTVQVKTNKGLYRLKTRADVNVTVLNETVEKTVEEIIEVNETVNGTLMPVNKTINKTILVPKTTEEVIGTKDIGLRVYNSPKTNLRKGLDLQGGTRVLLQPEEKLDKDGMALLLENMKYRLNVYGLSDVVVREASDLSGNQYILVEIAGANEEDVKELLAKQGKFEAKISNETVFKGGSDIIHVCRSADCSGIDVNKGCGQISGGGWTCRFMFSISLTPEAAKRQAQLTEDLDVITEDNSEYLSEKLYLYLDNNPVDELNIGADLKGRAVTDIAISGSGAGNTQQEAVFDSLKNMKKLQTILITGSLPVKLEIVKTDSISSVLGEEFIRSAILMGLLAIAVVGIIVFIRYRKLQVVVPMLCTTFVEVILLLGIASIIGWNLDLAAIAGLIIVVGTGIDHQIVITDETLRGEISQIFDWKKRIKNAFFIIMAAYLTTVVAMLPLLRAGAGLLKGFALTTIIGVSIGVFITRPAYASVIEILMKD